jgi:phage terminase large subunit-like protein
MAGNQLGKTLAGAAETAMHLTGEYPDWWDGLRFNRPIVVIAGSESGELTRDGAQRLLIGPPDREEEWGTGFVPQAAIHGRTRRQGVSNALDTVTIKHVSGGLSTIYFKSYDQGRTKWQANTVDFVWFDEEPPEDVYMEGITRTNATKGSVMVTFTPLKGMSKVVERYLLEHSPDRVVVSMTIEDAEHYTPAERQKIIDSYPPHERDARTRGIPVLGSGRVFPVAQDVIACEPIAIPKHWKRIGGMDFGWDHPFAAVEIAYNADADVVYVTKTYRQRETTPIIHAASIKGWWRAMPWSWPHDGMNHEKGTGEQLAPQYKAQGLNLLPERATFIDGGNSVEAGLMDMLERMQTGRLKVFSHLTDWFEEFNLYHRKDGKVVKLKDDLLSATRYAIMMLRFAETEQTYVAPKRDLSGYV